MRLPKTRKPLTRMMTCCWTKRPCWWQSSRRQKTICALKLEQNQVHDQGLAISLISVKCQLAVSTINKRQVFDERLQYVTTFCKNVRFLRECVTTRCFYKTYEKSSKPFSIEGFGPLQLLHSFDRFFFLSLIGSSNEEERRSHESGKSGKGQRENNFLVIRSLPSEQAKPLAKIFGAGPPPSRHRGGGGGAVSGKETGIFGKGVKEGGTFF